jgi:hypothetical protein
MAYRPVLACFLLCLAASCGSDSGQARQVVEPEPEVAWPNLDCDPLVPSYCGFPFPSNVFTQPDATRPTGLVVNILDATMPPASDGQTSSLTSALKNDGFSSGSALMVEFPGLRAEGLIPIDKVEASLRDDATTVLIEADTGKRMLHFSEIDKSNLAELPRTLLIRPAERLRDGTRYIVGIRGLVGETGPIEASPAFAALRDLQPSTEPSVQERRPLYADIFQRLAAAGVERSTLQLAWDFTTASRENNTGYMVHMRDEALAAAGANGPPYTITSVEENPDDNILFRIEGTMTVPLYLDSEEPGGRLTFGDDDLPEPNPKQPTREATFRLLIPKSAESKPAPLLQYGHGLLGSYEQIEGFKSHINEYNYAMFGLTLIGMAGDDAPWIAGKLATGAIEELLPMFDRQHQGMLEYLLAMRMMSQGFANDPTYGKYLNGDERYYHGISQGGIFGGTYMALSTDVERGVLGVMGMPYNLLLNRSVDFNPFFVLLRASYPDPRDQQFFLSIVQSYWDRTEPNGYVPYLRGGELGTPKHEVLMRSAIGDHQVSTYAAHIMARAIGAKHLESGQRSIEGLEPVSALESGSTYIEYEFGLPPEPVCNIPMTACGDPHGDVRKLDAAKAQMDNFLRNGKSSNECKDAGCSFPELSGCEGEEATPSCDI